MLDNKIFGKKNSLSSGIAVLVVSLLFAVAPGVVRTASAQGSADSSVQADVQKALDKKQFKGVQATVRNGEVTLKGDVDVYAAKEDADRRVHHVKNVTGVDNRIEVSGGVVEDAALRTKLADKLVTDRVGYATNAFNSLTLAVHDGVVTVGGTVYGPPDRDSAISAVENTPGVKDVIDNIEVAPLSPMDDQLRVALFHAIYGTAQLQRYALDPSDPIRISVANGNVTLSGVVDSKADSDVAGIRANTVSGVFKVTNNLKVAGPQPGR